jgi:hypothetical protein
MHREPTAISLVAMATPNMPVRSHRPMSENVVNSIPIMAVPRAWSITPARMIPRPYPGASAPASPPAREAGRKSAIPALHETPLPPAETSSR